MNKNNLLNKICQIKQKYFINKLNPSFLEQIIMEYEQIILDEIKEQEAQKQWLNETIEFCHYLLENDEIEIDNKKYHKHSCDDIITNAILKRLDKVRGE